MKLIVFFEFSDPLNNSVDFNGKGLATYKNGDTYDGYFKDGVRNGEGTYTYAASGTEEVKDTYKGQWVNNLKHGIGKQKYTKNAATGLADEYYGNWENGHRHGEGVMIYANKDIFSGQWKLGKKDGEGTYIFQETRMKYVGQFKAGQLVSGKWLYPNGTYFEGNFDNNQPKGHGKWHFENGNVVEGDYQQIKRADVEAENVIKLSWKTTSDITAKV